MEDAKKKNTESSSNRAPKPEKPKKAVVDRPEFKKPEFKAMPTCAKGKRVSKGKLDTRALMVICGG